MYQSDLKHSKASLEDKLHRLYTLNRDKKIDLSFRPPYLNLLQKLGNPHLNLPPVIHVAGTNGKGSTIAMLRSIYEEAGYKVHAYTSPHLIHFNERIVLAGQQINDDMLENIIDEALALNDGGDLTFFEITTAIAFTAFASTPADICLLEVGMGGRLDCTNVIENPAATVITSIGLDHTEHLGNTIEKIAAEKAGIIKENTPCIIGAQNFKTAHDMIEKKAHEIGAKIYNADNDTDFETNLLGPHQKSNMANAVKTIEVLQKSFAVSEQHIQNGLQNVNWRARLQRLNAEDFSLPKTTELYLDGGHNEAAAAAIASQLGSWKQNDNSPLYVILGMMDGKDTASFANHLKPFADEIYCVNIEGEPQSQTAQELQNKIPNAKIAQNYQIALSNLQDSAANARILICGSLYLSGQVLQHTTK